MFKKVYFFYFLIQIKICPTLHIIDYYELCNLLDRGQLYLKTRKNEINVICTFITACLK